MLSVSFFGVVLVIAVSAAKSSNVIKNPLVEHLLTKIRQEDWGEDEKACATDVTKLFEAASNNTAWAVWILDSMQLPVGGLYGSRYHLGNFDQCLYERWSDPVLKTQYCLVDVVADELDIKVGPYNDAEDLFRSKSKYGWRIYLQHIGVCLPASCSPQSIKKISTHIVRSSHLPYGEVTVNPNNCQKTDTKHPRSWGFYVFWFIVLASTAIVATVYVMEDYIGNTKWSQIAAWFSVSKNYKKLTAINTNDVAPLHGIRCLTSGIIVVIHNIYVVVKWTITNTTSLAQDVLFSNGIVLTHIEIVIHSFSVLSGFLFAKSLCSSEKLKPFEVLFKRYQRIIPTYAMVILYIVSVSPHTVSGPLRPRYLQEEHDPCVRGWWWGLIMMFDTDNVCLISAWYLSSVFHMTVVALIGFWVFKRHQTIGLGIFSAALLLGIIVPAYMTYQYRLSPLLIYDIDGAFDLTYNQYFHKIYSRLHGNLYGYLTGFATGYLMTVYKPERYRNVVSKRASIILSSILAYFIFKMMKAFHSLALKQYDSILFAVYSGLDRVVWSASLCGLVLLCEFGTLPIVTDFLSWKVFHPLSRLSYGVYLVHMVIIYRNVFSLRAPMTYDLYNLIINAFGYIFVSVIISYLQWFLIEAPAANMFTYFERKRPKIKEEDRSKITDLEEKQS